MNRKYLKYLIRERKVVLVFFFVLYLGISLVPFLDGGDIFGGNQLRDSVKSSLKIAMFLSTGLTFVLPVLTFAFVHRRKSADVYFALPISRSGQLAIGLLFCFGVSYAYFLFTACAGSLIGHSVISVAFVAKIVLYAGLILAVMTVFNTALFLLANNLFDGIVLLLTYTILPWFAMAIENGWMEMMVAGKSSIENTRLILFSPVGMLWSNFENLASRILPEETLNFSWLYLIVPILYAGLALLLLRRHFVSRKTERAEQVSDDPMAYPAAIHICTFLVLLPISAMAVSDSFRGAVLYYILILAAYVISMFVYRRKIRVELRTVLTFFCMALLSFAICAAAWKTRGFGMADRYDEGQGEELVYEYYARTYGGKLDHTLEGRDEWNEDDVRDVSFTLSVPHSEKERYAEVLDLMSAYRKEQIDAYYSRGASDSFGGFSVYNREGIHSDLYDGWMAMNYFHYGIKSRLLSEAELVEISRYADVMVSYTVIQDEDDWEYVECSLGEYLAGQKG